MATKVLIAEDEKTLLDMYTIKLEKEGFEVFGAHDGEEAVNMAKSENPDIILLDIIMPKIDGFTALEELRKEKSLDKTPIIMLTNLGQKEDLDKGKKFGATDYLVKANTTPAEVVDKINEVLSRNNKK